MAKGFAAHAANPSEGKNAITAIMKAVSDLQLSNELGEIASFYMEHIGFNLFGEHMGVGLEDEVSGKLSFNVGRVEVSDGKLIFSIDNRVPVSYPCKKRRKELKKLWREQDSPLRIRILRKLFMFQRTAFLYRL